MPEARYLRRPDVRDADARLDVELPYGLTAHGVVAAIRALHDYLHAINKASVEHGYGRLEDFMQAAGFSGLVSNVIVRAVVKSAATGQPGLAVNRRHNGRPDIVPRALYAGDAVHRGAEGIEVKATRSPTSWQGHNPEPGWLLVAQFHCDTRTQPVYDRVPTSISRIMCARLDAEDWTFAGRNEDSRRTPTASVNPTGRQKLEANTVYERRDWRKLF